MQYIRNTSLYPHARFHLQDKPGKLAEYSFKSLCADLDALLDVIGVKRAVSSRKEKNQSRCRTNIQ